ncbi:MAG: tryptophan 7-halogenase [Pseudomonadota bacterium]
MSDKRIAIVGPALKAGVIGAYLAARWAAPGQEVIIQPEAESESDGPLLLRPDHERFHAEIGLSRAAQSGNPAFAFRVETSRGAVSLPFSPHGLTNGGVAFHHFWHRANSITEQPDLPDFSLALALEKALALPDLAQVSLEAGWTVQRAKYATALLELARENGAIISSPEEANSAHVVIDCRINSAEPGWSDGKVTVTGCPDIPGLDWQICANAARRLVGLIGDAKDFESEQLEYSRLARSELDRIDDMRELLFAMDPFKTERPSLKRKIDLFEACGRIPTEDFEVFGQAEWLAALWERGIRPRRHDRMANAMPEGDLLKWLSMLRKQIEQVPMRGAAA